MAGRLVVEADGGSRGNPGPAGFGAVVRAGDGGEVLAERAGGLGRATNNVAEYRGLIAGLTAALELGASEVEVRMDSKLVVEQMSGRWQVKHPDLRPLATEAAALVARLPKVGFRWVPRERNRYADRLANEAMDAQAAGRSWSLTEPAPVPGPAASGEPADADVRRIGVYFFPGVEELDAVGPWEVLASWTTQWPDDGWRIFTFSAAGGLIRCANGLTVQVDHSEADRPPLDVLVYPGGQGTRRALTDQGQLDWVRQVAAAGTLMASVCTGGLVYAAAGLLRDRPATTHWRSLDRLAELDPTIDVRRAQRFVDDGAVVTAAGVSAGIDLALHLVARLAGNERSAQVRHRIAYDGPVEAADSLSR